MALAADAGAQGEGRRASTASRRRIRPRTSAASSARNGDPYAKVGLDPDGRAGIDWGVYGVPETFIVRGDGTIAYKVVGPMSAEALESEVKPQILKAMAARVLRPAPWRLVRGGEFSICGGPIRFCRVYAKHGAWGGVRCARDGYDPIPTVVVDENAEPVDWLRLISAWSLTAIAIIAAGAVLYFTRESCCSRS